MAKTVDIQLSGLEAAVLIDALSQVRGLLAADRAQAEEYEKESKSTLNLTGNIDLIAGYLKGIKDKVEEGLEEYNQ